MLFSIRPFVGLVLLILVFPAAAVTGNLSLAQAIRVAIDRDAVTLQRQAQADAARESATAAGSLPDPMLSFGLMNIPTDTFALDADPMTQITVGVRQALPAGDTTLLQERAGRQRADYFDALAGARQLRVAREVRTLWFRIRYLEQALALSRAARDRFAVLTDSLTSRYASGGVSQQAVLQATVELGSFTETILQQQAERDDLRAALARWLGAELAGQALTGDATLPATPDYPTALARLAAHPLLAAQHAEIAVRRTAENVAEEAYEPAWELSLQYGLRQGYNPMSNTPSGDMLSVMASMSLPLFTGNRQDRSLAAARSETRAAELLYTDSLRQLQAELLGSWSRWRRYRELENLYTTELLPAALGRAKTARAAYANGAISLEILIETELAAFETRNNALQASRERALAQTALLYLAGEKL